MPPYAACNPEIIIDKKSNSPDKDKSLHDAKAIIPVLKDFFNKHPTIKHGRRHFCDNPCTSSPSGSMIYIYPEKDLRAYPRTFRDTKEWDKVYKTRSVVGRSINYFKESFCIAGRKT